MFYLKFVGSQFLRICREKRTQKLTFLQILFLFQMLLLAKTTVHRESKTPNFIQSRFFENPTVIRSNFAQFAPNNVLKGKKIGYFLVFSINYRIKSRSNAEKYPIMIRILSNQVIGYFLERDWVFGRSIFTERIFFGVFGSLCYRLLITSHTYSALR